MFYARMSVNFDFIKFNNLYKPAPVQGSNVSFKAARTLQTDTFEKNSAAIQPQNFEKCTDVPVASGVIYDRKLNKPIKVTVLKTDAKKNETTYRFVSKNLKKEYGYLNLTLCKKPKDFEYSYIGSDACLLKNYPEYGIRGARVIVDYLENHNDSRYAGIGRLADKIAVKHCLDNNIKPVIISIADWDSHVAHYKRGKRYLPLVPDTTEYKFFKEKYGSTDVNSILEKLVNESELNNEKIDLKDWFPIPMYMPQKLAQKYVKELQSEKQ